MKPHLDLAKFYWKTLLTPQDVAIDATCGNGHDTLFLAQIPLEKVFAIDIQPAAIEATHKRLKESLIPEDRVDLRQMSHEALDGLSLPKAPRLIVYNLGYLPGGNKEITTDTKATLLSVACALKLIEPGGAISITCYPGHEEGAKEEKALLRVAQSLPSDQWHVCHHRWINRPERSPTLLWMSRNKKKTS